MAKKIIIVSLIAILCVSVFFALYKKESKTENINLTKTFVNEKQGYSFQYPANVSVTSDESQENITLSINSDPFPFATLSLATEADYKKSIKGANTFLDHVLFDEKTGNSGAPYVCIETISGISVLVGVGVSCGYPEVFVDFDNSNRLLRLKTKESGNEESYGENELLIRKIAQSIRWLAEK